MKNNEHLITLGFTTFRPETLPFALEAMQTHDLIVLEEPLTPGFEAMLAGNFNIDDYLMHAEFEFPAYAAAQCQVLRELHQLGKTIRQVHPWMDQLGLIHEFFTAGNGPDDLDAGSEAQPVYLREKHWTRKLISFYRAAGRDDFQGLIQAVREFARADALKIRDMDTERAEALIATLPRNKRVYVECGSIHHPIIPQMKKGLANRKVTVIHLMQEVCKQLYGVRRLLPPGDILTFRYMFEAPADPKLEELLAARAVVYNRLIFKDEVSAPQGQYPHMDNEALIISLVNSMRFAECRTIYERIRRLPQEEAMQSVMQAVH